jgi:hypothetical protein
MNAHCGIIVRPFAGTVLSLPEKLSRLCSDIPGRIDDLKLPDSEMATWPWESGQRAAGGVTAGLLFFEAVLRQALLGPVVFVGQELA